MFLSDAVFLSFSCFQQSFRNFHVRYYYTLSLSNTFTFPLLLCHYFPFLSISFLFASLRSSFPPNFRAQKSPKSLFPNYLTERETHSLSLSRTRFALFKREKNLILLFICAHDEKVTVESEESPLNFMRLPKAASAELADWHTILMTQIN